jgi:murein DD-endopeptidase MepM/ murein hydrolase activator NlpD
VRSGESLTRLFIRFGLKEQERQLWLSAIQKHHPIKALHPGQELDFYFARAEGPAGAKAKESLKALEIELNEDWILAWEKGGKGIVFSKREKPHDIELKSAGATVESSLAEDGSRLGIHESLLSQLADIFSWEVDFHKDIRRGDTFKLVYEQKSRKGKDVKTSFRVLAAELVNAGQKFFAIYFEKEKGKGAYYDLDGRSLARAFLRFPLEFTSISSRVSHSRLHPILKVDRPHNGVDFVAKRGTPVRAVAEGKILYAGWRKGGYGRMIEIEHDSIYSTRYAHLERLAQGLRKGVHVKKGQIIGYVGSTGMSTGPHLHFELYRDQEYVDPLNFEYPPEDRIEPALRRVFDNAKQLFLAELAATPHS